MTLNTQQFGALADKLNTQGGFSEGGTSSRPDTRTQPGYMVAQYGHEEQHEGPVTGSTIQSFAERHAGVLRRPSNYLGGWKMSGDSASLDVSRKHTDKQAAMAAGRQQGQYAIYDVRKNRDINSFQPPSERGTLFEGLDKRGKRSIRRQFTEEPLVQARRRELSPKPKLGQPTAPQGKQLRFKL